MRGLALASVGCAPVGTGLGQDVARRLPPARWDPPYAHRTRLEFPDRARSPVTRWPRRHRGAAPGRSCGRRSSALWRTSLNAEPPPSGTTRRRRERRQGSAAAGVAGDLHNRRHRRQPGGYRFPGLKAFLIAQPSAEPRSLRPPFLRRVLAVSIRITPTASSIQAVNMEVIRCLLEVRTVPTGELVEAGATAYVYSEIAAGRTHTWRF